LRQNPYFTKLSIFSENSETNQNGFRSITQDGQDEQNALNMNIAASIIYILVTGYITVYVGQVLFKNGRHFILRMLMEEELTDSVNRILLTGYYLVNLGYVSIMLTMRAPVESLQDLVTSLSTSIGRIMLTLAVMHYFNIAVITLWNKLNIKKPTI
jgi:hypothetical protein